MIFLDEQLSDERITQGIRRWYRGRVAVITEVAPDGTVLHDDAIPRLLQRHRGCTLVTINVRHFWRSAEASSGYAIVCLELPSARVLEVPSLLRRLLSRPGLGTKAERCGKVILVSPTEVRYYRSLSGPERILDMADKPHRPRRG